MDRVGMINNNASQEELQYEYKHVMRALREPISDLDLPNPQIQLKAVVAASYTKACARDTTNSANDNSRRAFQIPNLLTA